jgi:phosphoglycerate dehydrogenase-like enzyme
MRDNLVSAGRSARGVQVVSLMRVVYRGQVFEAELVELARRKALDLIVARDEAELLRELPGADALWITPTYYQAAIPQAVKAERGRLKWIGLTSAGYDVLLRAGVPPGVTMTYAVTVHGPAVAEHAVALVLALVRQLPRAITAQIGADWDAPAMMSSLRSLEDLTVAIVGFGSIGGSVAERLRPLAKRIVGVSRAGHADARADEMFPSARLHDALAQSDVVILTVAFTEETRHMIDAAALAAMPAQGLLVNVARGPVVDSAALRHALADGRLAGAALDVTDPEPLPAADPLWQLPGVIVTPHISSFGSRATGQRLAAQYERNVDRLGRGEALEGTIVLPTL